MKSLQITFLAALIGLMLSCQSDDFTTGLKGTLYLGMGDCMPVIDEANRDYEKYDGRVYFIEKSAADTLGQPGFVLLKNGSTSVVLRNGKMAVELPAGTFLVMPEDQYFNDPSNTITITEGQITEQDVKIWICTSF